MYTLDVLVSVLLPTPMFQDCVTIFDRFLSYDPSILRDLGKLPIMAKIVVNIADSLLQRGDLAQARTLTTI